MKGERTYMGPYGILRKRLDGKREPIEGGTWDPGSKGFFDRISFEQAEKNWTTMCPYPEKYG